MLCAVVTYIIACRTHTYTKYIAVCYARKEVLRYVFIKYSRNIESRWGK